MTNSGKFQVIIGKVSGGGTEDCHAKHQCSGAGAHFLAFGKMSKSLPDSGKRAAAPGKSGQEKGESPTPPLSYGSGNPEGVQEISATPTKSFNLKWRSKTTVEN